MRKLSKKSSGTGRGAAAGRPVGPDEIAACLDGDENAWRRLLADYGALMRRAVRWTLGRAGDNGSAKIAGSTLEADVDDVVQEVCYRLVRGRYRLLKTFDPERASFATWLCVVARSAALDHLRNRRHILQASMQELEDLVAERQEDGGMLALPRELLSARQAYVLHMTFERDASTEEIAQLMDVHPQTVRSVRNAALTRLRWHYGLAGDTGQCKDRVKPGSRNANTGQSQAWLVATH